MMNTKTLIRQITVAGALVACSSAWAVIGTPTPVQFSETGAGDGSDGSYNLTNITTFDWVDTFSTVIDQNLVGCTSTSVDCTTSQTLDSFFAAAASGDTLTFDIYSQTYLDGFTNAVPSADDLQVDYEVTATLSATETATVLFNDPTSGLSSILFTSITGSYTFYYDACSGANTCDSNIENGTGFDNGTPFLWGDVVQTSGSFTAGSGDSTLTNTVTGYDNSYIEADPASGAPLIGSIFSTQLNISFDGFIQNPISTGSTIGESGDNHTVASGDLILRSDASTPFSIGQVPEPTTLALLGMGLFGLGGMRKFKR